MEREQIELDLNRALAQIDQLSNALTSAVSGPFVIGVTVDQAQLNQFNQQLNAADLEVDIDSNADELTDDLQAAVDASQDVSRETREIEAGLGEAATEARRLDDSTEGAGTELRDAAIDAGRLENELSEAAASGRSVDDSVEATQGALRQADRAAGGLASEMRDVDSASASAQGSFASIGQSLRRAAGAAVAFVGIREAFQFVGGLVDEFAAFDEAITGSLAIVGDVSAGLRQDFEETARAVSEETTFAARQAGEAYFFLASAGLDAEQQIAALPQVAQFAQAGLFDLATATDLLTDAQSALGLSVDDAQENLQNLSRVSDVLVQANILANASVQQFSEALTNRAGAALRQLNKDVEEGVAVLAAFADQGLKGQRAGEALNIVFRDLQRAALNTPEAFEQFGVTVFDQEGNFRNIADVIGDLEVSLAGLSDAQVRARLTTLGFQDRSISNLLTLLGTSEAIRAYETDLRSAGGATQEVADNQLQSVSARLQIVQNDVDNARQGLGEALLPAIESITAEMPELLEQLERLGPTLTSAAESFVALASNAGTALEGLGEFQRGLASVGDFGETAGNVLFDFAQGIDALSRGDVGGFFDQLAQADQQLFDLADNTTFRVIQEGFVDQLEAGEDQALAFANAVAALARNGQLTEETFERFAAISGLTSDELADVNLFLRENANQASLSAGGVAILAQAYLDTAQAADIASLSAADAAAAIQAGRVGGFADEETNRGIAPTQPELTRLDELRLLTDEIEGGYAALQEQLDGEGVSIFEGLTPRERDIVQYEIFQERIGNLRDQLRDDVPDIIEDLDLVLTKTNEAGEETAASAQEITDNLISQFETQAEFEANLARIAASGADSLAEELRNRGPDAAEAAAAFVDDTGAALEAESVLEGQATENVQAFADQLAAELQDQDFDAEATAAMLSFATGLSVPAVREAIRLNTLEAVEEVPNAIRTGLQIRSPSRVTRELGEETAAGFYEGLEDSFADQTILFEPDIQVDVDDVTIPDPQFDFDQNPELEVTPTFTSSSADTTQLADVAADAPGVVAAQRQATVDTAALSEALAGVTGGSGGAALTLVNVNPTVQDVETSTAKQLQIAAGTLPLISPRRPDLPRR